MSKQSNLLSFLAKTDKTPQETNAQNSENASANASGSTAKKAKLETNYDYSYKEKFLEYGFTVIKDGHIDLPQCVICESVLANSSMKANKLQRHFHTNHGQYKDKPVEFFMRKRDELKAKKSVLTKFVSTDNKLLKCSYMAAFHIARCKKAYTIGETLLKPCMKDICGELFGKEFEAKINSIPLSNDTIARRIIDISNEIEAQLIQKLEKTLYYAIQMDESTDISNNAILLIYVRYEDYASRDIEEELLCCLKLETSTTSEEIFGHVTSYFEMKNISLNKCVGICTDGAAAMTGQHKGLVTRLKRVAHPDLKVTHCFLHREQLAAKDMSSNLHEVLNECVTIVNYIRKSALKTRIFKILCEEMGSEHQTLFLHSHIRWLSRGKVLKRFFELRMEIEIFLREQKSTLCEFFQNNLWLAKVAYLADIFSHMNDFNLSLQGKQITLFNCYNKIEALIKKIQLWIDTISSGCYMMLPSFSELVEKFLSPQQVIDVRIIIQSHLKELKAKLVQYFPSKDDIRQGNMWVLNPFSDESSNNLTLPEKEQLIELSTDKILEQKYQVHKNNMSRFWLEIREEYPILSENALKLLLPFGTTYLAESGFSNMVVIKTKLRNRLDISSAMRISLTSSIDIDFDKLVAKKQQHPSH